MLDLVPYAFLRKLYLGGNTVFEGYISVSIPAGYKLDGFLDNDPTRDDSYGGVYPVPSPAPTDSRKVTVRVIQQNGEPATVQHFQIGAHAQATGINNIDIHVADVSPGVTGPAKRKGKVVVVYSQADDRMTT